MKRRDFVLFHLQSEAYINSLLTEDDRKALRGAWGRSGYRTLLGRVRVARLKKLRFENRRAG